MLCNVLEECKIPETEFDIENFHTVFRRLMQEHIADRIYSRTSSANSHDEAVKTALQIAQEWFGPYRENKWPVERRWLKNYIRSRYHGSRRGVSKEDQPGSGRKLFEENNPTDSANCEWILGCNESKNLEIDHVIPASFHGKHTPENYQYLCKDHNQRWKGNLLFWDSEIPLPAFWD